jgi:hypothetical protein
MVDTSQLRSFYQITRLCNTVLLAWVFAGCATSAKVEPAANSSGEKSTTHYTFKAMKPVEFEGSFPGLRQVQVEWHKSDGTAVTSPGFRTWDVNHDGSAEMIEMLDESGRGVRYFFDFNQDGILDWEKTPGEKGRPSLELD